MLRRALLAASASGRVRRIVTTAPLTRGVVARFVAGDTADDALAVTRRLLDDGLLVSLDYLGEDTVDPEQATAVAGEYIRLLERLDAAGMSGDGRAEVSVKPTAVGLDLPEHGEKTACENIARICAAARDAGTTVTLDMEEHTLWSRRCGSCASSGRSSPTWAA
jgi:proline dehydrogenase